jgi:hypothetical protein
MLKHGNRNTINWSLVDKKWHEDRNERIVKLAATLDAQKGGNSMSNKSAFEIHQAGEGRLQDKGFFVRFNNGYKVSVQFGAWLHCDRGETTAEVAVFDPEGDLVKLAENNDVLGRVSPEKVAELMFDYSMKVFDKSKKVEEETV